MSTLDQFALGMLAVGGCAAIASLTYLFVRAWRTISEAERWLVASHKRHLSRLERFRQRGRR